LGLVAARAWAEGVLDLGFVRKVQVLVGARNIFYSLS
jgi:hypothetical protein